MANHNKIKMRSSVKSIVKKKAKERDLRCMDFLHSAKTDNEEKEKKQENIRLSFLVIFFLLVFVWWIISKFFFQINFVHGNSMSDTLNNNAIVLTDKGVENIKRHDIVVVRLDNTIAIKRVIGLPNDRIEIRKGFVYYNGIVDDNFRVYTTVNDCEDYSWSVGEDEYFLLGDNREESYDSRDYGMVKKEDIIGVVSKILWKGK